MTKRDATPMERYRLRYWLMKHHTSISSFAKRVGLHYATVENFLEGWHSCKVSTIERILEEVLKEATDD